MRLKVLGLARPVRRLARSSLATPTAFSIFSSASKRVSSIRSDMSAAFRCGDQGADGLAPDRFSDVSIGEQVEHDDRHGVVHAEAEGGGVGHLQAPLEHLAMGDL